MWTHEDIAGLWGWLEGAQHHDAIPIEERCWKCDGRRIHEGCAAGLCTTCCEELKAASAA